MKKNVIIGIIILILIIASLYFGGVLSVINGTQCDIVKEYPNACDDYTDCKYIEFEGNTIACINGEKIIYNIDSKNEIQTPQIMTGGSSK